jgi:hypothetical protein
MLEEKLRLEKRTVQYWYEDGIPEIGLGSTCLMMAGYFALNLISAAGGIAGGILLGAVLLTATIPYSYYCSRLLVRTFHTLKEKWTYPRAGLLRYRGQDDLGQSPLSTKRLGLAAVVTVIAVALQQYRPNSSGPLLIASIGLAALLLYIARVSGKPRFYALSAYALAAGTILLAFPGMGLTSRLAIFCASQGLALTASGVATLRRFIKTHPIPNGDEA